MPGRRLAHGDEHVEGRDDVDLLEHDLAGRVHRREGEDAEHVVALRDEPGPGFVAGAGAGCGSSRCRGCRPAARPAASASSGSQRSIHCCSPATAATLRAVGRRGADAARASAPGSPTGRPRRPASRGRSRRVRSRTPSAGAALERVDHRVLVRVPGRVVGVVVDDLVDVAVAEQSTRSRRRRGSSGSPCSRGTARSRAGRRRATRGTGRACRRRRAARGTSRRARSSASAGTRRAVAVSAPLCTSACHCCADVQRDLEAEMTRRARARRRRARARAAPCGAAARRSSAARR